MQGRVIEAIDERKLALARTLSTTTKVKEREQRDRKSRIDLEVFVAAVLQWQKERPPLFETDMDLELLILLFLGEIDEIEEHRLLEGLPGYDFKSEVGETNDAAFFLASLTTILKLQRETVDFTQVLHSANGQADGSYALEKLREVGGNLSEKNLKKELQYLWTLWVSYLIHMKFPVTPTQTLREYTIPKNNGNYAAELLAGNPLFEQAYGRRMDREEKIAYFTHYRKATRIIRDFMIQHVDPAVEHTGLLPEHYRPYKLFIFSFTRISGIGINADQALVMLEQQLYKDYGVQK